MAPPPDRLYQVARVVLDTVVATLENPPPRRYVSVGNPAFDCEQVVVSVDRTLGHAGDIAQEVTAPLGCLVMRAVDIGVWVIRCAPTMNDDGQAPSAASLEASAAALLRDPVVILNGLVAAHQAGTLAPSRGLGFLNWQALAPEGGFAGGVQRIRLDLTGV